VRAWSHSHLLFPLGAKRRYPLPKYALLRERVAALLPIAEPGPIAWPAVERTHDPHFAHRMRHGRLTDREERVIGLPWSPELIARSLHGIGGTLEAARDALDTGVGIMLGGGTHHAGRATARGFCVFNDLAIVTHELRREGRARRVLVVDLDVHQGDGTADLLAPDPDAFTLSVQCGWNGWAGRIRIASDLDVELPAGTQDDAYMNALDAALEEAIARFPRPDLVLYVAGADPWEGDRLGRLSLTKDGLRARDERVFSFCRRRGLPVAVTLAGGYAPDVTDTVDIHAATITAAAGVATA
jgi:acetoin utilization deacetylase AcuC-like enzyme